MDKKRKILIVIISIVSFYFALPVILDQIKIEHVAFIPKSEYKIGEKIIVYGISMHSTSYGDGCGPKLEVQNSQQVRTISLPQACTTMVIHEPALEFYERIWDQKNAEIQVAPGQYILEFMGKSFPITIVE